MTPKQRIRIILVASSLLLLGCIETGWAGKDPIPDDDGNVIMEAEIEENMGKGYRTGCVIGGAGLAVVPAVYAGIGLASLVCLAGGEERCDDDEVWLLVVGGAVVTELAVIILGYYEGKRYDRGRAIKRIKARRRQQKEHALGKPEMSGGFRLQLLKVTF